MTYDQLEAFAAIVALGSFKAAAKQLRRTQPTLSVAIKKLEAEYGLLLFSRDEYRPKLTPQGKVFHTWAQQCLLSYRNLQVIGQELGERQVEPSLTLIVDPLTRFEVVAGLFRQCLGASTPTVLTLKTEILDRGKQALLAGTADFAVAVATDPHSSIESTPLDEVELVPVMARRLAESRAKIDRAWLQTQTQVIVTSGDSGTPQATSVGLTTHGRTCLVTDHGMKQRLIAAGFGWGQLARHEIAADLARGTLVAISPRLVQGVRLEVHAMRNRRRPMGPTAQAIWAVLAAAKT